MVPTSMTLNPKIGVLSEFLAILGCDAHLEWIFAEITWDRPRQPAYEMKLMLSRISWALAFIVFRRRSSGRLRKRDLSVGYAPLIRSRHMALQSFDWLIDWLIYLFIYSGYLVEMAKPPYTVWSSVYLSQYTLLEGSSAMWQCLRGAQQHWHIVRHFWTICHDSSVTVCSDLYSAAGQTLPL